MWITILAQDAGSTPTQPQAGGGGLLEMLPVFVIIYLIFWFLVIRPQRQQEKQRKERLEALQKNDKVQTRGGIRGTIARVEDDTVVVRIDTDGKLQVRFAKDAIEAVLSDKKADDAKK